MFRDPTVPAARPRPLFQRVIGIVVSPAETMAGVAATPQWTDVLALVTVLLAVGIGAFMSTAVGQSAFVDQQVATREAFGVAVTASDYTALQQFAPTLVIVQPIAVLFLAPLVTAGLAGLLYGAFVVLGGQAHYKQVLAVVAHTGVILLLQMLCTLPLHYRAQSLSSTTSVSVLFPDLPDGSLLASLVGFIDLFWIWYLVVLAIGVGTVYRRRRTAVAGGLFIIYVVVGLVLAATQAALGGR